MLRATRMLRAAAAAAADSSASPASWGHTLKLPKSTFPARPSTADLLKYRIQSADQLYAWQKEGRPEKTAEGKDNRFVLHDGPPYANGAVHVGHALNKITKDLVVRLNLAKGRRVEYRPGWDCHGLPIELKALQAYAETERQKEQGKAQTSGGGGKSSAGARDGDGAGAGAGGLSPIGIRQAARQLASKTMEEQKLAFQSWAVMGDWDKPYTTMDRDFEVRQLGIFRDMVSKGLIYRQHKPVHWSPSSGTALAEAELEYDDAHHVVAAYVKFPLLHVPESFAQNASVKADDVSALIWTTTPWTLPANKAIAVRSDMEYCLVEFSNDGDGQSRSSNDLRGQMIVAKDRVQDLLARLPEGTTVNTIIESIPGSQLEGTEYANVLSGESGRIVHADFVTSSSGTGLVHIAPGHGMDDYNLCMKLGIGPAFAPVDDQGRFTDKALPADPAYLQGQEVEKSGAKAVISLLREASSSKLSAPARGVKPNSSLVLLTHNFKHKNPIDWRTKQPVIVRATEQWFADTGSIKHLAMSALESVTFIPEGGKARLQSFLQGRSQWCISRQRSWGVPIPALFHKHTGEAVITPESINHIIAVIEQRGTDAWWTDDPQHPAWLHPALELGEYVRGTDTMDVWFDSGTAWSSLTPRDDGTVADVFLEGTDQHRGWFQSSLLTYVSTHSTSPVPANTSSSVGIAPFRTLITHGFTLDATGRKMSKSLGNVISPAEILNGSLLPPLKVKNNHTKGRSAQLRPTKEVKDAMGPDVLRLWVASADYTKDVVIGQPVLKAVHQSLQKYRVTMKWLLGVLEDYPAAGPISEALGDINFADQVALYRLTQCASAVWDAYEKNEFYKAVQAINKFVNADLSAFYFEVIKDRLYADDEPTRQHTQTILFIILDELCHMLAPITPLLIEEVWAHMPAHFRQDPVARPHLLQRVWDAPFSAEFDVFNTPAEMERAIAILDNASTAAKAAQEAARRAGRLGASLACRLELLLPRETAGDVLALLVDLADKDELSELLVVSHVDVLPIDQDVREEMFANEPEALQEILRQRENPEWSFETEFDCGDEKMPAVGRVLVAPPFGEKCVRCWQYIADEPESLCGRCADVVGEEEEIIEEEEEEDEEDDDDHDFEPKRRR